MKNRNNIVILAKTKLDKNSLFKILFFIKKNPILFVNILILALIKD